MSLRRVLGAHEELQEGVKGREGAAVDEIQGTKGVDGMGVSHRSQPEAGRPQTREVAGEANTVFWTRTAFSPPARGSKAAPGFSNQGPQGLGSTSTILSLLPARALLLLFKWQHTGQADLTSVCQSPVMALCDVKITHCFA